METETEAMCPTATLTKSTAGHRKKMIILTLCLAPITLLIVTTVVRRRCSPPSSRGGGAHLKSNTTSSAAAPPPSPSGNGHEDSTLVIKKACASTLHPSLCFAAISAVPAAKHAATFRDVLEIGINQSLALVSSSKSNIGDLMAAANAQALNSQVKIALNDCLEMLDQSIYELRETLAGLDRAFPRPPTTIGHLRLLLDQGGASSSQSNIKTLLSAAMTNENTCLAGLSDLGGRDSNRNRNRNEGNKRGLEEYVENMLTPITRMISDCLAFVRFAGSQGNIEDGDASEMMITNKLAEDQPKWEGDGMFPAWMTAADRNLMERESSSEMIADAVVARNGSGDYRSIGEAVRMAPSTSPKRFVIRVRPGVYSENVEIPRDKVNIMLVGSGASHTMIAGSRNFADGYSTFTSATLTVVGDKFLARELSIVNTAGPWKHQAVAARVTSNAAFYRCNFASHQDTLYAHSLRQFYRECTIEGTIDFIFGNAAAIFQNCTILVRRPIPGQENVITAQGREDPNQNTGISLDSCSIVAAPELKWARRRGQKVDTYLGRPWRKYSRTMVMKSYLGELIHPKGWSPWNEHTNLNTLQYIEFMNIGPGSKTAGRVRWPGYRSNCSEKMAQQFTVEAFFRDGSADQWLQSTGFPLFPSP